MKETKFKNTEIGRISEEWSICNFGDIFTFFSNNTLSRDMWKGHSALPPLAK